MKNLVITLPAEALLHVVNAYCGQEGCTSEDEGERQAFALECIKADLLRRAQVYNVQDQTTRAIAHVKAVAEAAAEALVPYVSLAVEDAS